METENFRAENQGIQNSPLLFAVPKSSVLKQFRTHRGRSSFVLTYDTAGRKRLLLAPECDVLIEH